MKKYKNNENRKTTLIEKKYESCENLARIVFIFNQGMQQFNCIILYFDIWLTLMYQNGAPRHHAYYIFYGYITIHIPQKWNLSSSVKCIVLADGYYSRMNLRPKSETRQKLIHSNNKREISQIEIESNDKTIFERSGKVVFYWPSKENVVHCLFFLFLCHSGGVAPTRSIFPNFILWLPS